MLLVFALLLVVAVLVYAIKTALKVDESNCKCQILLEDGRCQSPCAMPPPCTYPGFYDEGVLT